MKEITEEALHLYVVNKNLLDLETLNKIEELLSKDTSFQDQIKEIKEFYSIYEQLSLKTSNEFILCAAESTPEHDKSIKLAAMQSNVGLSEQTYLKTFLSADNYIITRIFYNPIEQEYDLYVIPEDNKVDVSYAVLYLSEIGKEFVADSNGVIKIKSGFIDFPQQISIRIPIAKFNVEVIESGKLNRNKFPFKNDENDFMLELELTENVLYGVIKDKKNNAALPYKIYLIQSADEEKIIPVDAKGNKFEAILPTIKDFIITVLSSKE